VARRPPAVARVLERVTATAREHGMFSPRDRVLVAVSGGPDSTCLLYALHLLRRLFRVRLEVFHFDHRLRPDSAKDAEYVRRVAARLQLPFHLRVAENAPAKGQSVEDWAHGVRWNALQRTGREVGATRLARGHTLDDQVETVLIQLIRGGGLEMVAGMNPRIGPWILPLVDVRRNEARAFVRALGLRPREDPTNLDTSLLRNALRLEGIPTLERLTGREIAEPVARTARLLRADEEFIRDAYRRAYRALSPRDGDPNRLPASVAGLHPAIGRRLARGWLHAQGGAPPEEAHVDAILDLAAGRPGRRRDLGGGLIAVREREYVRLSRTSPGDRDEGRHADHGRSSDGRPARTRTTARPRRVAPGAGGS
jgi:tRNA(Ile)-lysidine synthase